MTRGIRYYSYPDHSGYGRAAFAYVRALHNAGIPVWWSPLILRHGKETAWRREDGLGLLPIVQHADNDAEMRDLTALLEATGPRPYDTLIIHSVPEHWPGFVEKDKRNIGYTVWETDALPSHWPPLLKLVDLILVPCTMNRKVFMEGAGKRPVKVVPHIRRHSWTGGSSADGVALRRDLGIPQENFLFYSINVWDPRKALADLVAVFARTFCRDDNVSLVLKTSTGISPLALERNGAGSVAERVRTLQDRAAVDTGRPSAQIALLAVDAAAGRVIDALHATGDCFVSLSHGEGWGMGTFDAATLGKPVLIAPFGGPADYLPPDYPGFIDYSMVPVSGWVAGASFQPPQCWAQADSVDAARKLRRMVARHAEFFEPAALASEHIVNRYAEPVVARDFIAALDG